MVSALSYIHQDAIEQTPRLYVDQKEDISWTSTQRNVDTKERRIDIIDLAPGPSAIWIDGRRQQPYGPWTFYKGSDPIKNGIVKWHYGRPKTSLCLFTYIRNGLISLLDFDCNNTLKYVCEIRMDWLGTLHHSRQ